MSRPKESSTRGDNNARGPRRAELLGRAAGIPVIPAVAGEAITSEGVEAARNLQVWRVLDGRAFGPNA